jgi:hypothetical protein
MTENNERESGTLNGNPDREQGIEAPTGALEHSTEKRSHGREPTSRETADRALGLETDPAGKIT